MLKCMSLCPRLTCICLLRYFIYAVIGIFFNFLFFIAKYPAYFFKKTTSFYLQLPTVCKNRIWWTILSTGICQYPWKQKLELSVVRICDESYGLRARISKRLRGPGIEESIPRAYVAWQARTTNMVFVPARQARNRFLAPSLKGFAAWPL
jgi:hypothetical protein